MPLLRARSVVSVVPVIGIAIAATLFVFHRPIPAVTEPSPDGPIGHVMQPSTELALLREARTVHDMATLRFDELPQWSIAILTAGPSSGSATVPGAYIEAESGRFVNPHGAPPAVIEEGSWKTLAGAAGSYSWMQPLELHERLPNPDDSYSPFRNGGTILYRPGDPSGRAQFGTPHMIFPDWVQDVATALVTWQREPEGLAPLPENRLLAVHGFRAALEAGSPSRRELDAYLAKADDTCSSVLVYLLLVDRNADHDALLHDLVETAHSAARLRSLAVGAAAAALFDRASRSDHVTALLRAVRERLPRDDDGELGWIFSHLID